MNMKVRSIWFSGCIFLSTTLTFGKEYKLWYNAPATVWEEALPIGNGRIGAMVYGGTDRERLQVNEESIWLGGPVNRHNPDAKENLPKIRQPQSRERVATGTGSCRPRRLCQGKRTLESQCTRSVYSPFPAYGKPDARPTDAGGSPESVS